MFTLLHTNDFHNHLTPTQADILRRLRQAIGSQGLLVDAGDAVASGNVTFRPWGESILKTMSDIGYDAMTVGNREFHVSQIGFHAKVKLARFPVLCANVHAPGLVDQGSLPVCSHIVCTLHAEDGTTLKVVLFGLTVPMVTERMAARYASAYLFDPPIAVASRLVPEYKEAYSPDLIVALTHIGHSQDRKLAEAVPGIDLILGGHSHTLLPDGERIGNTLIAQTGCFGHYIGRVDIMRNDSPDDAPGRFILRPGLMDLPKAASETEIETQVSVFRGSLQPDLKSNTTAGETTI